MSLRRLRAALWAPLLVCFLAPAIAPSLLAQTALRQFDSEYELLKKRSEGVSPTVRATDVDRAWAGFAWLPDDLPVAGHTPEALAAFDEGLYRRAVSIFQSAARKAARRERTLNDIARSRFALPGGPWWLRIDLGDALDRLARRTGRTVARSMADDYSRVISALAEIRNAQMRASRRVQSLRQAALRRAAIERLAVGETLPALKLLEDYRRDPGADLEWPLHYHLARAYGATFRDARRDRGVPEADLLFLRRRKNLHTLRAVELRHGLWSPEYGEVWKRVRLEELGSPRSP